MDDCAAGELASYSKKEHAIAAAVIFVTSLVGTGVPVLAHSAPSLRRAAPDLLLYGQAFGTGVVLATALIHMLPPAMELLTNPCLGPAAEAYGALAPVFALAAIFVMQLVEYLVMARVQKNAAASLSQRASIEAEYLNDQQEAGDSAAVASAESAGHRHHHVHVAPGLKKEGGIDHTVRARVTALLFEAGVAFHSVLIGLSLGVLTGNEFDTLFVALVFHQFFEGVAVGSVIAAHYSSVRGAAVMVLTYTLCTPVGIFLGIAIAGTYNESSSAALWTQGVFDAVSAGILLYAGLVELLTYQITMNPVVAAKSWKGKSAVFLAIYTGAAAMAVVGKWA